MTKSLMRVLPFLVVLIVLAIRVRQGKLDTQALVLQPPVSKQRFCLWYFGYLVFWLVVELSLYNNGLLTANPWHHSLLPTIIRITGAVILAPVAEELLFRTLILNFFAKKMKLPLAIALQAVLFVAMHNYAYQNNLDSNLGIIQGLLDATLYAMARYHTRSIYTPIAMHMTGNSIAIAERFIL